MARGLVELRAKTMSEFYPNQPKRGGSARPTAPSLFDQEIPQDEEEISEAEMADEMDGDERAARARAGLPEYPELGQDDPSICPECLNSLSFSSEGHSYCPDCEM